MPGRTILLIDDDATLLDLLGEHLEASGYGVVRAEDGLTGLNTAAKVSPDLVVLDVMMPGMAGWQVCERLRSRSQVPIILLTAKGEEVDKLRGFRLGIDDFVTKPFSFAELTARIGAVLARGASRPAGRKLSSGDLRIDFDDRGFVLPAFFAGASDQTGQHGGFDARGRGQHRRHRLDHDRRGLGRQ